MEILLIAACAWLAYTAGAQSEQSKLGMPPGQRDAMREQTRHEKAVRKIADKHGDAAATSAGSTSPWGGTTSKRGSAHEAPDTFRSGYRSRRPARPPLGHRAGTWAGDGLTWAQDTGRDAWQKHRKRRKDAGHDDPGPVLVPLPPDRPPMVPPIPGEPPRVGADATEAKPDATVKPPVDATVKPDEVSTPKPADTPPAPEPTPEEPKPEAEATKPPDPEADSGPEKPAGGEDATTGPSADETAPKADMTKDADTTEPTAPTVDTPQGVGRMASEVTYESVMDESDELSIMCDDDARICDRIYDRAEREIGRGDTLAAEMQASGWGPKILGWLARCKESYGVIRSEVLALQHNTIGQGEAVVMAKSYLEAGQGVYADIAKDMESVLDRQAYISDAVDAEDTSAHTEIYETKAAS